MNNLIHNNITITTGSIISKSITLIFHIALIAYHLFALSTLPEEIIRNSLTITFIIYVFFSFISFHISLADLCVYIKHNGRTINIDEYNKLLPSHSKILIIINWIFILYCVSIGFWFCSKFIPVNKNNCDIYTDYPYMCISFQIVTIFMIFTYALATLFFIVIVIILLCFGRGTTTNFTSSISSILPPLPTIKVSSDNDICSICWEKPDDTKTWTKLNCGHLFHINCVNKWLKTQLTCPMCRSPINSSINQEPPI